MQKMDPRDLRKEYQELGLWLAKQRRDCFMGYVEKLMGRYGVYAKTSQRLKVASTLKNLGAGGNSNEKLLTYWLNGSTDPLSMNHSREKTMDIFLKFHLYEFELEENQPLDFMSVSEAFHRMLEKLGQEPLYLFNQTDFCVQLAMKLQSYEEHEPLDIFMGIKNTYEQLKQDLSRVLSASGEPEKIPTESEHVDITETAYRQFMRIQSLGDASDETWPASGIAPITAFQFINRYREDFNRVRVTPFLILSQHFGPKGIKAKTPNWDTLQKNQLTSLAQENIAEADELAGNFDLWDEKRTMAVLRSYVRALKYEKTVDRSSLLLLCALFLSEEACRSIAKDEDFLSYFNDMILAPCGYAPMDPRQPSKSQEDFAVLAAIRYADLQSPSAFGYPLGEYICKVCLGLDFAQIMDMSIFA